MKAELKARWIAALRSGKYQQDHGFLRSFFGYCCLGVLCDVVRPNQWTERDASMVFTILDESSLLPHAVARECEIIIAPVISIPWGDDVWQDKRIPSGHVTSSGCLSLASLNDWGFSFNEIADLLEKYLPVTP